MNRGVSIGLCMLMIELAASCGTCNPRPIITSISPATSIAHGNAFVLVVNGEDFVSGAVVSWDGIFLPTLFVSSHELTGQVSASNLMSPGVVAVLVINPSGSSTYIFGFTPENGCGGSSNEVTFTIT